MKEDFDDDPGSMIPDGIDSEAFVRSFHFGTEKGSLLGAQKQESTPIVFAMRKNHDLSRHQVFQFLDWNIDEAANDEELQKEMEAQAKAMAAAGVKPGGKGKK